MLILDSREIAALVSDRCGIDLRGVSLELDGGTWPAIRPLLPEEPNGFSVVLSGTPRLVTAMFRPDRFAGRLLSQMAAAEIESKQACAQHYRALEEAGMRVLASLDDRPVDEPDELTSPWTRLELECELRRPPGAKEYVGQTVQVATACITMILALLPLEADYSAGESGLPEGARLVTVVNRYERSAVNRATCLLHLGYRCQACDFDFEAAYGPIGRDFIEVHHRTPVSKMGGSYRIDPIRDLVPVCPNCHAMLHRRSPPLEVDELRELLNSRQVQERALSSVDPR